ncbi:hypothetical protein JFN87_18805 [Streptomyces bomunensis]|uniref:Uncharacterized protein n=1 Tax=Streptomyces montanisoli TaxID=2798581 RepID=A0A940MH62_9ACTN|nr:hypothetical protein [Streptomyces montanisoli]MBP0459537.1 hypothetical protein [Streptomyces montanisoli]
MAQHTGRGAQRQPLLALIEMRQQQPNTSTNPTFVPSDTLASYDPTAHEKRRVIDRQAPSDDPPLFGATVR